jgi:LacI family transcriptional regulator, gluconate utilization system Gnt-I transcriptional repressor
MTATAVKGRKRRPRTGSRSVTLSDVAALAKVSEVTVSRILRNKGYISAKSRERVMAAIGAVGYRPNRIAGTLASAASSNLVGVVIPSLSNIVFPEVLQGIHTACETAGLQPVVGVTDYNPAIEERLVDSLLAWQPTALLVAGFDHTETTSRQLRQSRVRIAELMDIDSVPIDVAVGLSHRAAGNETAAHLIRRGYRRFGYVGHDWHADRRAKRRYDGLCEGLAGAGLSVIDQTIFDGSSSVAAGRSSLAELLGRSPDLDVVVFSNDDMAIGGVFHCMAEGIVLKDRLAIFGFNGLGIGQSLPIPLSTIRSNRFLIGKLAVEKILEQPERPDAPITIDAGYELVEGGTA